MITPWGASDRVEVLAEGIVLVDTPSHGGIHLSPERLGQMPKHLRKGETVFTPPEWFEEDCEVAYVFLAFPELFPQYQEGALKTAQAHYPIMYQKIMELS